METEFQYDYWKEEIHKCHLCNEWIENKIYRYRHNNIVLFFHPFCFRILKLESK